MSMFGDAAPAGEPELTIVRATFQGSDELTFSDLITGYTRLRVLTYSNFNCVTPTDRFAEA
jgi:hypothetical protein